MQYESWRGLSRRELEPLGLVLKAGAWHLVARPVGKPDALTFRLASLLEFKASARHFKRPARFDLAAHWRASTSRFEAELHREMAHIAASPRAMKWLANARTPFTRLPSAKVTTTLPPDWQECVMPIESIERGARMLLGYGAQVKVAGPAALRDHMASELASVMALYGG